MKNPLSFLSPRHLEASWSTLTSRFPIATILVAVLTGCLFYVANADSESYLIMRVVFTLVVTFFFSIGVTLFAESEKTKTNTLAWQLVPILYGIVFFFSIRHLTETYMIDSVTFSILHLVGFISFLFFAPYLRNLMMNNEHTAEYTNHFTRVAWTLLMSGIVGAAIYVLGAIAIASVTELFNLSGFTNDYNLYENWAIIAFPFIAPLYGLIHLPTRNSLDKKSYETNRFFSFLVRYVATPFIILYFIILYAYSVKVLANFQEWPKGMISWMVVGFSTFGYLTYIFSKPYEEESDMVRVFRKVFPYLVPAQILMLGYAIYLRIDQYDLTMNRYFVVIFGVWLAIISGYYIVSKRKSLTMIAASLTAIALIISVGPWGVYQLPLTRQYNRLITNLEASNMLSNGVISKKSTELTRDMENSIYSEIQYVCEYDNCEKIKELFAKEIAAKEPEYEKRWRENSYNDGKEYPGISQWEVVEVATKALDISYRYESEDVGNTNKYITINLKDSYDDTSIMPLNVTGYTTLMRIYNKNSQPSELPSQYAIVDPDAQTLTIRGLI